MTRDGRVSPVPGMDEGRPMTRDGRVSPVPGMDEGGPVSLLSVGWSICRQNWGSWVVFPEPVSPAMMMVWLACKASMISVLWFRMGRMSGL